MIIAMTGKTKNKAQQRVGSLAIIFNRKSFSNNNSLQIQSINLTI
jgi:hypothetical protein